MTSHDAQLRSRTDDLARALEVAGGRLDQGVAEHVREAVSGVRERLALGVDHRIVALAGGTGSGKSSLFNRLTRLDFADVGAKRPTTARVTACAWSPDADPLLDWLQVSPERRISRDGELDGVDESQLHGLVLLDLPDHDSIAAAHRDIVDRILPMVDLLVWVVDPQKYADDALHSGYLQKSAGLEGSMMVAVNQIDTIPEAQRESLVEDMDRLLRADGLDGVYVTQVSARTGEGIESLRHKLEQAVARRSVAAGRVAGELDRAGSLLLDETPSDVPWSMDSAVPSAVASIGRACGVEATAGQLSAAVRNGYGRPEFAAPQHDAVAVARAEWVTRAGARLRPGWHSALESVVAPSGHIVTETRKALARLPLDTRGPASARAIRMTALSALAVAVVFGVLTVLGSLDVLTIGSPWSEICAIGAVAALVVAVVFYLVGRRVRNALAQRRGQQVIASANGAIERVVEATMNAPTQEILDAHREVRELAQAARDTEPAAPLTGSVPVPERAPGATSVAEVEPRPADGPTGTRQPAGESDPQQPTEPGLPETPAIDEAPTCDPLSPADSGGGSGRSDPDSGPEAAEASGSDALTGPAATDKGEAARPVIDGALPDEGQADRPEPEPKLAVDGVEPDPRGETASAERASGEPASEPASELTPAGSLPPHEVEASHEAAEEGSTSGAPVEPDAAGGSSATSGSGAGGGDLPSHTAS